MKRVVKRIFQFSILVLAVLVILAFVGVQPLSGYKDDIISWGKEQVETFSLFTPALPFDLAVNSAYMTDYIVYLDMRAIPNDRTATGREYTITTVGNGIIHTLLFTDIDQSEVIILQLDSNSSAKVLAKLGLATGIQAERNLSTARLRLEEHDFKYEEIVYDYFTGRSSAPSYETWERMAQTRRVLVQDIASAEYHLSVLADSRSFLYPLDVSARDVIPYLVITEEGAPND